MVTNNSGLQVLLFLMLALVLAVPLLLLFSHYGSASLPSLSSHSVAVAATAGLLIIPVLFLCLAAIILAAKTRRAGPVRVRYPWEDTFPDVVKLPELHAEVSGARRPSRKVSSMSFPGSSAFGIKAVLVSAMVILLLVAFAFWSQRLFEPFSSASNMTKVNMAEANASLEKGIIQPQPGKVVSNTARQPEVVPAMAAESKDSSVKTTGQFRKLASGAVNSIQGFPPKVWQSVAAVALAVILIAALFYSSKSGQLSEAGEWLRGTAGWLAAIPAAMRRDNFAKILMFAVPVIGAVAIAGYVFRKWLGARLPGFAFAAGNLANLLSVARDFIFAYRLYILVGLFALLAIVGFLMASERRGTGKKQGEANSGKQPKNSARLATKKNGRE